MAFPVYDRWERKLQDRNVVQRHSARYTKPGYRPRALSLVEARKQERVPGRPKWHPHAMGAGDPTLQPTFSFGGTISLEGTGWTTVNGPLNNGTVSYPGTGDLVHWPGPSAATSATNLDTTYGASWVNGTVTVSSGTTITVTNNPVRYYSYTNDGWVDVDVGTEIGGSSWAVISDEEYRKHEIRQRLQLQQRSAFPSKARHRADFTNVSQPEIIALQMLKGMLDDKDWRRYLTYGFVLVEGESGLLYQIIRDHHHIRVFRKGHKVAELCIYINGVPPTDQVIAKKIMLECSEMKVWHDANIKQNQWSYSHKPTERELVQLAMAA